jgi:hypothetical protein
LPSTLATCPKESPPRQHQRGPDAAYPYLNYEEVLRAAGLPTKPTERVFYQIEEPKEDTFIESALKTQHLRQIAAVRNGKSTVLNLTSGLQNWSDLGELRDLRSLTKLYLIDCTSVSELSPLQGLGNPTKLTLNGYTSMSRTIIVLAQ